MNPKREINKLEQGRWWCSDAPGPGGGHIRAGCKVLYEVSQSFGMPVSILYIFGELTNINIPYS